MTGFNNNLSMREKWIAFINKIDIQAEDYSIVLNTINRFLYDPFIAAIEDTMYTMHWNASIAEWRE